MNKRQFLVGCRSKLPILHIMTEETPKLEEQVLEKSLLVEGLTEETKEAELPSSVVAQGPEMKPSEVEAKPEVEVPVVMDQQSQQEVQSEKPVEVTAVPETFKTMEPDKHPPELYAFLIAVAVSVWLVAFGIRVST